MLIYLGGGGAITHCALLSNKWQNYLYNDLNEKITSLFIDAVNGKYHDEHRVITRQDFLDLKDTDAYVKYIWSFGNAGDAYLWGKDIEQLKCQACRMLCAETVQDRRLQYRQLITMLKDTPKGQRMDLESLEALQALSQLEALQRLEISNEALQRLEISNIDYQKYEHKDGDVVYCDVPYEQKTKTSCDDYGVQFDSLAFYEWVKTRDYQVFFSSYEISDNSFYRKEIKKVRRLLGDNSGVDTEYLYSNRPFEV